MESDATALVYIGITRIYSFSIFRFFFDVYVHISIALLFYKLQLDIFYATEDEFWGIVLSDMEI